MTITGPLHVPEEQMTLRARAYLMVGSLRHLALGVVGLALPETFDGRAFKVILDIFDLWFWAVLFIVGGVHLSYAAVRGSVEHARVALVISACLTSAWAGGFFFASKNVGVGLPLVCGLVFAALVLKDLVQCAQPLRSPFEPFVRKYVKHQAE